MVVNCSTEGLQLLDVQKEKLSYINISSTVLMKIFYLCIIFANISDNGFTITSYKNQTLRG